MRTRAAFLTSNAMTMLPYILLAQHDDNSPMRFIGVLIVIAVVVLGNLLQWLQKHQEQKRLEAKRRQAQMPAPPPQQTHRPTPGRPRPLRTGMPMQRRPQAPPLPPVQGPYRQPTRPQAPPVRPQPARRPPTAPPLPAPATAVAVTEIGSAAKSGPPAASPQAGGLRALLNARGLRRTYILTEILQPPVSLREPPAAEQ